jgi:anti-sigma B factor antagonist
MEIVEERRGEAVLLRVKGRLDSGTSGALEERLLALVSGKVTRLVLNFNALDYISSAGLRVLLMVAKKLKPTGGVLVLCNLHNHIREIFDLAGFSALFPIHDSEEAALKALP